MLALAGCTLALPVRAAPVLELDPRATEVGVEPYLDLLEDPGAALTPEQVRSAAFEGRFTPLDRRYALLGLTPSAWWLRVRLRNPTAEPLERLLAVEWQTLTDVRCYAQVASDWVERRSGRFLSFAERDVPSASHAFRLSLPPHSERAVYLRLASNSEVIAPVRLWQPDAFRSHEAANWALLGIYFGAVITIAIYQLFLYWAMREPQHLWFVGYITLSGLWYFTLNGAPLISEVVRFGYPFSHFLVAASWPCLVGFARGFLEVRRHAPGLDRVLATGQFVVLPALVLASVFVLASRALTRFAPIVWGAYMVLMVVAARRCQRAGQPQAGAFVVAGALVLGSLLMASAGMRGLVSVSPHLVKASFGVVVLTLAAVLSLAVTQRIRGMGQERARAESLAAATDRLARYFPRKLVERLLAGTDDARPASTRREVAILFADLRGFTDLTDRVAPERITRMLNAYLSEMGTLIERHGGTLDKFMGDGVMVLFGAPDDLPARDQARAAVELGVAMHRKFAELAAAWSAEGVDHDVRLRVGIHQDYVTVGNFGSADLVSYTAIGGGVNLASRLEQACTPGRILVGYGVYTHTQDAHAYGPLTPREVKGFARPVRTAELDPLG